MPKYEKKTSKSNTILIYWCYGFGARILKMKVWPSISLTYFYLFTNQPLAAKPTKSFKGMLLRVQSDLIFFFALVYP